ncbi:hypothetical protein CH296_00550 [Rhodococcus sp. 14-2496-1d]|uniref:hypothetical protein n=1 Tax=Rhodococcus sp. 14-2496-1d TaxID=2023146 RepID=UPI000B9C2826|nr:hypothetical protein [Rhodococcus sp. 14-2496-1d]OZF40780.1 hypothetical protein CH296_00550 [Rhodococcus sp. 14-2496-1d]
MRLSELQMQQEQLKKTLADAYRLVEEADRRLASATPGSPGHAALMTGRNFAVKARDLAERELESISSGIDAMKAGGDIEAIEKSTFDVIQWASIVVGIGYDPDDPDALFIQSSARHHKRRVCPSEAADLLRQLASQLEANHPPHN